MGLALAIYLPSFLLIAAILLLLAALSRPVWVSAIRAPADVALVGLAFMLLDVWKRPARLVAIVSALATQAQHAF